MRHFIELSISLARAQFKLRNEGSCLGILWYLLNPILLFILLLLVFSDRLGNSIDNYPAYLLMGIIMFNLFQQVTSEAANAIKQNKYLIKSVLIPRESLILSIIFKNLFSHFLEILVFSVILFFFTGNFLTLIFYPIILVPFCLFIYGFSLVLATITIYFFDMDHIWLFISRLIWFATPIFYHIGGQTRLFIFSIFNPMYYFITVSRDIIIYNHAPELWLVAGIIFYSLLSLVIGIFVFNKFKNKFAELI